MSTRVPKAAHGGKPTAPWEPAARLASGGRSKRPHPYGRCSYSATVWRAAAPRPAAGRSTRGTGALRCAGNAHRSGNGSGAELARERIRVARERLVLAAPRGRAPVPFRPGSPRATPPRVGEQAPSPLGLHPLPPQRTRRRFVRVPTTPMVRRPRCPRGPLHPNGPAPPRPRGPLRPNDPTPPSLAGLPSTQRADARPALVDPPRDDAAPPRPRGPLHPDGPARNLPHVDPSTPTMARSVRTFLRVTPTTYFQGRTVLGNFLTHGTRTSNIPRRRRLREHRSLPRAALVRPPGVLPHRDVRPHGREAPRGARRVPGEPAQAGPGPRRAEGQGGLDGRRPEPGPRRREGGPLGRQVGGGRRVSTATSSRARAPARRRSTSWARSSPR